MKSRPTSDSKERLSPLKALHSIKSYPLEITLRLNGGIASFKLQEAHQVYKHTLLGESLRDVGARFLQTNLKFTLPWYQVLRNGIYRGDNFRGFSFVGLSRIRNRCHNSCFTVDLHFNY
jgi:hypothetical protein